MKYRVLSLSLLALALAVFLGAPLAADEKTDKNSHIGKFVSAKSETHFVMEFKGKEHSHTLAVNAKVLDADAKECKLTEFKKGQKIRVTTQEADMKVAVKVEAVKEKTN